MAASGIADIAVGFERTSFANGFGAGRPVGIAAVGEEDHERGGRRRGAGPTSGGRAEPPPKPNPSNGVNAMLASACWRRTHGL